MLLSYFFEDLKCIAHITLGQGEYMVVVIMVLECSMRTVPTPAAFPMGEDG